MTDFHGKTALVTGATSGIGRAIALALGARGAFVVATGRNAARGAETVAAIEAMGGKAWFQPQDIVREREWVALMGEIESRAGQLDIAVNCAGAFHTASIENTSLEEFQSLWRTNVESCFLGTREAMRLMIRHKTAGAIVNIASLAGHIGVVDCAIYCASKAAVIHMSEAAAAEAATLQSGIRVNVLSPGVIWTEMITGSYGESDEVKAFAMAGNALQRIGTAQDSANGVVYLASDAARHVNGTALIIDGGRGAD